MKQFEKGKTYYSVTRQGRVRLFKASAVLRSKTTGKRLYVVGSYDGKPEARYEIHITPAGDEWIDVDRRFCTVVDATEWRG